MTDNLEICTRCGSDALYKQPISPEFNLEYCFGCGFQHSTAYYNSEYLEASVKVLPNIYKILMDQEEDTGKIWIPSFINSPGNGLIYVNGFDRENWWWEAGKFSNKFTDKMETKSIKKFPKEKGFMDAMEYLGLFEQIK